MRITTIVSILAMFLALCGASVTAKAQYSVETLGAERIPGNRVTMTLRVYEGSRNVSWNVCQGLLHGTECQIHPHFNLGQGLRWYGICRDLWYDAGLHAFRVVVSDPNPGRPIKIQSMVRIGSNPDRWSRILSL